MVSLILLRTAQGRPSWCISRSTVQRSTRMSSRQLRHKGLSLKCVSWAGAGCRVSRRVLSDELWERIEPLLPAVKGPMGRPFRVHRQVIEGIVYRYRAGIAWRVLPGEFGLW